MDYINTDNNELQQKLKMFESDLIKNYDFQSENFNPLLESLASSISTSANKKMRLLLALSELILFTSQFRINMQHWGNSIIPINGISFLFAKSGASKDSSLRGIRKCFNESYNMLRAYNLLEAEKNAIAEATKAGEKNPTDINTWKKYYQSVPPLFVSISTTEGLVQHINDLSNHMYGAGYMMSGEFGTEMTTSPYLIDNIKLIAEIYDEGSKEVKVIKNRQDQSKCIENFPMSAMLMTSQDNVIYDDLNKKRLKTEFNTKLARRSFVGYILEEDKMPVYQNVEEYLIATEEQEREASFLRNKLSTFFLGTITPKLMQYKQNNMMVTIDDEAKRAMLVYQSYNELYHDCVTSLYPIYKTSAKHLYWKAYKVAGALALSQGVTTIDKEIYSEAMRLVEYFSKDTMILEKELDKESYETFVDYVKSLCSLDGKNKVEISLHNLKKMNYLTTKNNPIAKMKELILSATSVDENGIYTLSADNTKVIYEQLQKTDIVGISYISFVDGETKTNMKYRCDQGYKYTEVKFDELEELLCKSASYMPFKLKDGIRLVGNEIGGSKILILDIDKMQLTDTEAHLLLANINHYIVRSSDPTNEHKYRIVIELDTIVDLDRNGWKRFAKIVAEDLGFLTDDIAKSENFFSYSESAKTMLKITTAEPLPVKKYVQEAVDFVNVPKKDLSNKEKSSLLSDKMMTFANAFEAEQGSRSKEMIKALYRAKFLGADKQYLYDLANEIHDYQQNPLPQHRFENTILKQIERIYEN